ncbi:MULTISPECIES: hypothetical protein [unclassified Devosia]|uniref:hypothetical protein n=1 Tax=unclassified Devosia TaxID=196773 RepID=UPI00145CC094|nr:MULTISPECIES: hypothetical protein [unclassified Devosia]MBJ6985932.1 hypothetical protein [Devosia sp. MC521]MBJ7579045.1 hypothetical protein [Devosia sp. MC532]MBK1793418.1 hypothetical protein [Devosia sp. WQ 349K1]QMW61309.1 hypothetical protein H4N61_09915 [Devosia sp. MC521]
MTQTDLDPDPYAELEYRADAFELAEDFRKPIRVQRGARKGPPNSLSGALRRRSL